MSELILNREEMNEAVRVIINSYDNYVKNNNGSLKGLSEFDVKFYTEAVHYKYGAEKEAAW